MDNTPRKATRFLVPAALLFAAVLLLFLGPHKTIVCTAASWPNTMLGDQLGHVDGTDFTGCVVPTRPSWAAIAALVLMSLLALFPWRRNDS